MLAEIMLFFSPALVVQVSYIAVAAASSALPAPKTDCVAFYRPVPSSSVESSTSAE